MVVTTAGCVYSRAESGDRFRPHWGVAQIAFVMCRIQVLSATNIAANDWADRLLALDGENMTQILLESGREFPEQQRRIAPPRPCCSFERPRVGVETISHLRLGLFAHRATSPPHWTNDHGV